MALDATNRAKIVAQIIRDVGWPGLSKPDLKAAVDAIDDWADTNAVSFNTAIPQPARGVASNAQKALLLAYVCMRRAGILKTEGE
jgi:hypothetical protein